MTILKSFFFSLFRSRSRSLAPGKQDDSETLVRGVYGESDSQELSTVHHALNLCCIKTEFVTAGTDATLCLLLTYCTVYLVLKSNFYSVASAPSVAEPEPPIFGRSRNSSKGAVPSPPIENLIKMVNY